MSLPTAHAAADPSTWGARNAHDPTVVRGDDGLWYMFSTDAAAGVDDIPAGVHVRTSPDLVEWTFAGTALDGVPARARAHTGAQGLWAPEVVRWPSADGAPRWHMYYSASTFGSRTSVIGLATAASPAGPWTDAGPVVTTTHESDAHNAIDAAVVFDRDGRPWLTYGSFFGGIHILPLDPASGFAEKPGEVGSLIARRPASVDGAVEGPYIVYRPEEDRFVLFVSYDSLFDSYSVRVAVADDVTGPYLDVNGRALTDIDHETPDAVGTKILGGHRFPGGTAWSAPGHNSVFRDGSRLFLVHHVRRADDPARHEAQIRRVHVTASGWPLVSPHPFAGADRERLAQAEGVDGEWHVVQLDPARRGVEASVPLRVLGAAHTDGQPVTTPLIVRSPQGDVVLDAVVFGAWDPVAEQPVLAFAGLDPEGVVWTGSKAVAS
ncbi:arabinan endo-1,5-alpha-L-arabinosidase [Microbacterium sp. M3]|uniref:Arabinan endo-1,5-alpha-L-arabinosidase n=1 Tax=Microbacterium arthrosphaerae TaxID=792652 RepID=A0ABU4H048_9MICO|nr:MULTISPECIES: arabinan endo-1,5-alpha-L-arabinosidase [Microbacterium]MDW4572075.1 arabinan endo-1,5-alpha-L-arabinosidase [Microbacterium arthrosphaerae]MDW7605930.1 arabinan endo-1,5-alpha-L-arabinosidase [Microbacterium sp. M3]